MSNSLSFSELVFKDLISIFATALLVGISVPVVKAFMDDKHFRKQKEFERVIRLQENLLTKKIKLLEDSSQAYWTFYFCCITLTYSAIDAGAKFKVHFKKYEEDIWKAFGDIRKVVSPASYLMSEDDFKRTIGPFLKHLEDVDFAITGAVDDENFDWNALHEKLHRDLAREINQAMLMLAKVLSITSAELSRSG